MNKEDIRSATQEVKRILSMFKGEDRVKVLASYAAIMELFNGIGVTRGQARAILDISQPSIEALAVELTPGMDRRVAQVIGEETIKETLTEAGQCDGDCDNCGPKPPADGDEEVLAELSDILSRLQNLAKKVG